MQSMTGYGRATVQQDGRQLTVEMKSVNHRFLDLNFRMPRSFLFLEDDVRRWIGARVSRGHLDVFVTYRNVRDDAKAVTVDEGLLRGYCAGLETVKARTGVTDDRSLMGLLRLPDLFVVTEAEEDQAALRALMKAAVDDAVSELNVMRAREGQSMRADLTFRADEIERMTREIETRYPETVAEYQVRLKTRVEELLGGSMDEGRLVQEVAIMADRAAISEEIVRITSHVAQVRALCAMNEPVGRKLDFIVQELNREINTISSKSQDIPITQIVVACKAEIEKMREQLQNVE